MPALTFLAVVGLALIALLFVADATLEPGSPAIVTSQRSGLPEPQYHNAARTLTNTPAPAPNMTSQAVLAAQPKSAPDAAANIGSAALAARAKAPHKDKRVTGHQQSRLGLLGPGCASLTPFTLIIAFARLVSKPGATFEIGTAPHSKAFSTMDHPTAKERAELLFQKRQEEALSEYQAKQEATRELTASYALSA
jgi:hypothetical protein